MERPHDGLSVLHLSTSGIRGGAARAAFRIHRGLLLGGIDSGMLVAMDALPRAGVVMIPPPRGLRERIQRRIIRLRMRRTNRIFRRAQESGYERLSGCRSEYRRRLRRAARGADIVHLHWISGFVDFSLLPELIRNNGPLIWTLHDMNAFTGGCHYDGECGRYREGCGSCPQLDSRNPKDLSRKVFLRKSRILERISSADLRIVTPSRWLGERAAESILLNRFRRSVIPYGIDLCEFAPRDRIESRRMLGIPADRKVVLFVSQSISNRRKGLHYLLDALGEIRESDPPLVVTLGGGELGGRLGLRHQSLGLIRENRLLSIAYSAADLFVIPSLQDNLPNTAIEAMACGVPVIGFAAGGVKEIIRDGETGLLVPPGDSSALARAIAALLDDDAKRAGMSAASRSIAEKNYPLELQAARYRALYEETLSCAGKNPRE